MKKSTLSIACALALAAVAAPTMAEVSLSANVALTTDYVWRGLSLANENAAIQGGFDAEIDGGFYAGIWGSNADADSVGTMEVDFYLGWATELDSGLGVDIGAVRYQFPGYAPWNTEEYYLGLSYGMFGGMASYSNDFDSIYWEASVDFELPSDIGLGMHVGYWNFDGDDSQTDWKVAISKTLVDIDFELAYTDTNIKDDNLTDGRVFLTASKGWE